MHQEYHQETITNFVMAHLKLLENKPSAFISVSLSAVLKETEAQKYLDRFAAMTGWRPRMTLLLGGALRYYGRRYGYWPWIGVGAGAYYYGSTNCDWLYRHNYRRWLAVCQ